MGYYTHYSLEWNVPPDAKGEPRCKHAPQSGNFCPECGTPVGVIMPDELIYSLIETDEDLSYALGTDNGGGNRCKWYEHEKRMREVSTVFRGVLFTLSGEGEESPDLWKKYFLNGKMQKENAQIVYSEFDKSRLE